MVRLRQAEPFVLIGVAAVGAGVHAAIAPAHVREWLPLGTSFVAVAIILAAGATALALRPDDSRLVSASAALLGLVAIAYLATRLVALPPLDPEREPFDTLGICTSAIEALGVLVAIHLRRPRPRLAPALSPGGTR